LRLLLEFVEVAKSFQECVLNRIFGIFAIVGDMLRDSEKPSVISIDQLFEGTYVPLLAGVDERHII
jgi:hypothetical protein